MPSHSQAGKKGTIVSIKLIGGTTNYSFPYAACVDGSTSAYDAKHENVEPLKTQTLFSYEDKKGEVHWTTKEYTAAISKRLGYVRASFDKVIELE